MLTFKNRSLHGFSLVELLIALAISLFLMTGAIIIGTNLIGTAYKTIASNKMNFELQNTLTLIANDVRRAGYWNSSGAQLSASSDQNPFMSSTTNISISNINAGTNNCILFAYDRDKNGILNMTGTVSNNDHFGYRLNNNAIQALTTDTNFSCTAASAAWENITDPNYINVTGLSFTLTPRVVTLSSGGSLTIRQMQVSISAQLVSNTNVITNLSQIIRVRSDLW